MFHATKISTYPCINLGSKPLEFYNQFAVHFSQLFNNVYILEALWTLISDRSDPYKFCFYCYATTYMTSQVLQPKSVNKWYRGHHTFFSVHYRNVLATVASKGTLTYNECSCLQ